jgi:hypothetical protein
VVIVLFVEEDVDDVLVDNVFVDTEEVLVVLVLCV